MTCWYTLERVNIDVTGPFVTSKRGHKLISVLYIMLSSVMWECIAITLSTAVTTKVWGVGTDKKKEVRCSWVTGTVFLVACHHRRMALRGW